MNAFLLDAWAWLLRAQTLVFGALGYYLAVLPVGLFLRLFGDPLNRPKPGAKTYWRERKPRSPEAFDQQG